VRRWLFNLAAVVSVLLFASTRILWVRSYWMGAFRDCNTRIGDFALMQDRGWIYFHVLGAIIRTFCKF
jgi:hypothetical protein